MIPYGRQDIRQEDIDAVVDVLRSDFLTQGPAVARFEGVVASRVRATHAIAVNSATSALHVACLALGVAPGSIVWTVPNSFVASANCARYCGGDVDFVDIDPDTWNLSVAALKEKLVRARQSGRLPQVLVPVHFSGQPTDQEEIWQLAREYGFRVLEDASHAIGASRNGEPVGSCRWSDITVFSFHPVKIVTTGEGGMALTNDAALAERMMMFRSHGITRDGALFRGGLPGGEEALVRNAPAWYYEQQTLGYNYRLTDIQAVLGISQLERIEQYVDRRNMLAKRYDVALRGLSLRLPTVRPENTSAFHLYVVRLAGDSAAASRRRVFDELRQMRIGVNVHYMPIHLQPYYRELGFGDGYCPEAEAHGSTAITLPLYPTLTEAEQDEVIAAVRAVL
jgi:UDP-4-amino-4,6-dideoxy-N-acetyl-beta-L-altrosamine transaminase